MTIEDLLEELEASVTAAWSIPLSGDKCILDREKVLEYISDIKENLPDEIINARAIVADRVRILDTAKKQAEAIIVRADEKAKQLVEADPITREAERRAREIMSAAEGKSVELKKATALYVDDLLKRTEEAVTAALREVSESRKQFKSNSVK